MYKWKLKHQDLMLFMWDSIRIIGMQLGPIVKGMTYSTRKIQSQSYCFPKENIRLLQLTIDLAISLYVFIKFSLKIICNRLKVVLPSLVTENQCAFLKNRSATDNTMIGLELISQIQANKSRDIAIKKLHLTKAFDCVQWSLIIYLLLLHFNLLA